MTWSRFDDNFTESREWEPVSFEARWHYHALVGACSRGKYWDGVLPWHKALGCSDVTDPEFCLEELESIGRVTRNVPANVLEHVPANRTRFVSVTVTRIDEHVPSEQVRAATEKARVRMKRKRAHDKDNHEFCDPKKCPGSRTVPANVPDSVGTGQDRTALRGEHYETEPESETANDATCVVCHQPMLVVEEGQQTHPTCGKPRDEYNGGPVSWDSELRRVSA